MPDIAHDLACVPSTSDRRTSLCWAPCQIRIESHAPLAAPAVPGAGQRRLGNGLGDDLMELCGAGLSLTPRGLGLEQGRAQDGGLGAFLVIQANSQIARQTIDGYRSLVDIISPL